MDKSKKWLKSVKGKLGREKDQPGPEQNSPREVTKSIPRLGKTSKADLLRACSDKDEKRVCKLLSKRIDGMTADDYLECMRSSVSPDAARDRSQVPIVDHLAKHAMSAPCFSSLALYMDDLWCHISPQTISTVGGNATDATKHHLLKRGLSYPTNAALVKTALHNGIDPNTCFGSEPAFLRAVQSYDLELILAFLPSEEGSKTQDSTVKPLDINITNARKQTALHIALSNASGSATIATFLLDRGADPSLTDIEGRTALHRAAQFNHTPILERILDRGVDIALADKSGRTALHWAAERNQAASVRILLARGAPVGLRTTANELAIHLAGDRGNVEVFNLLREDAGLPPVRRPMDGLRSELKTGPKSPEALRAEPKTRETLRAERPVKNDDRTMWPDYVIRDRKSGSKTVVTPSEAVYWN